MIQILLDPPCQNVSIRTHKHLLRLASTKFPRLVVHSSWHHGLLLTDFLRLTSFLGHPPAVRKLSDLVFHLSWGRRWLKKALSCHVTKTSRKCMQNGAVAICCCQPTLTMWLNECFCFAGTLVERGRIQARSHQTR